MENDRLAYLFEQMMSGAATDEQRAEILTLMKDPVHEKEVKNLIFDAFNAEKTVVDVDPQIGKQILKAVLESDRIPEPLRKTRFSIQPYQWLVAAAVALIVLGVYFFNYRQEKASPENPVAQSPKEQDVAPGDFGATLTLANGKKIRLAKASNGELAKEAGISISKTADGRLVYEMEKNVGNPDAVNTLSTAKGETYQVHLPDGSLVYLNAASSLTYRASLMEDGKRVVQLNGEGYFEIAKDKTHPFIVKTGKEEIEVLGTHFNISSYTDDEVKKTTLLEGSVRFSALGVSKMLKPGQQAQLSNGRIRVDEVDTDVAVAWKNNEFLVESERIETIMKMVERWYNVEVVYVGAQSNERFSGGVSRFDKVSKVLDIVESTGEAHFEIKGRKIYVFKQTPEPITDH